MRKADESVGGRDGLRANFRGRQGREAVPPHEAMCEVLGRV